MTTPELLDILADISFHDWRFYTEPMGDGFSVQVRFRAQDNFVEDGQQMVRFDIQHGRKWYVSSHATREEVVQTCLKAVLTALEHEAREQFTYRGVAVFQPHMPLMALVEHARSKVSRDEGQYVREAAQRAVLGP